jgi:hydrogenase nickel incorporation protein HypA/HybF
MHELSVCQALLTQVEQVAQQHQATTVERLIVQVGVLSGIEPELLQQAFSIARMTSPIAQHSVLVLESLPIRVHCSRCDRESTATANRLICGHCGEWQTRLVSGDELLLKSVELVTETTVSASI